MRHLEGAAWTKSPQKRTIDLIVGSMLSWSGPVSGLVVAPEILFRDRMNPFFVQTRYGGFGWKEPFHLVKFRTMPPEVAETESLTGRNDPRATEFGSMLRATKVDELWQSWPVILGKMALVGGYRPLIAGGREAIIAAAGAQRQKALEAAFATTKPGWTSPWSLQRERADIDYDPIDVGEAIIEYAKSASFKGDNEVFEQTFGLGLTRVIRAAAAALHRPVRLETAQPDVPLLGHLYTLSKYT